MKKPFAVRSDKMAGRKAFLAGVQRAQCPYPASTVFAAYWLKGWDYEKEECEKLAVAEEARYKERMAKLIAIEEHNDVYSDIYQALISLKISPRRLRDFLKDMPE